MVQIIPPKPVSGLSRFVESLNSSLSQSLPKYVEHGMLSQGLKNLSQKQDLTPQQYYHELLSIPGVANHPAIIEGAQKLAREQMNRQGLSKRAGRQSGELPQLTRPQPGQSIQDVNFGPQTLRTAYNEPLNETPQGPSPQKVKVELSPEPAFREKSPFSPGQAPFQPWSDQKRSMIADDLQSDYPYMTREQALNEASQLEAREKAQYEAERGAQLEKQGITKELKNDLLQSIQQKLQKEGPAVYEDVSGDFLEKMQEGMRNDLLYHPEISREQAIKKWSDKALDHAKNVKKINEIQSENQLPETKLKKLSNLQKQFAESGTLEEYKKLLQSKFGFSPQFSSKIAYPRSSEVSKFIKNFKPKVDIDRSTDTIKAAEEIIKHLGPDDSPLAVASSLKNKIPYFNEGVFFDYLRDNQDKLALKEWQKREITDAENSIIPQWADILYTPWFGGRSIIND